MFHGSAPRSASDSELGLLLEQIARCSTRPRYAFMLLTLIADAARADGSAGPMVSVGASLVPLRDWLCDALTPMGGRDPRRQALEDRIREAMARAGELPADPAQARLAIDEQVRARVRASGKTNLSRAVSELVNAGLLRRHYQGYRVDHHNRGAQRQAVYTLIGRARSLIGRNAPAAPPPRATVAPSVRRPAQPELPFG